MSSSGSASSKKQGNRSIGIISFVVFVVFSLFLFRGAFNQESDRQFDDLLLAIRHVAGGEWNVSSISKSFKPISVSDHEFSGSISKMTELLTRSESFLDWIADEARLKSFDKGPTYLRWDRLSNADVHIIHKLKNVLQVDLSFDEGKNKLLRIMKDGYQCTPLQAAQQEYISKYIKMDICSEVEWYKLIQFASPELRTFLDVGANKGYLGSLFLSLWGGGNLHISPAELFAKAQQLNSWKGSRNPAGYCRDGLNFAVHLYCPSDAQRDPESGNCLVTNSDVRVHSFDGSSYLTKTNRAIVEQMFPASDADSVSKRSMWDYSNFAVSDVQGTARFTKQSHDKNAGYEGGGIRNPSHQEETEEVPLTSLDAYVVDRGIRQVDLIKIDTEGNDNKVLTGAQHLLKNQVSVFTFEGGKGVTFSKEMVDMYNDWGYNCYSSSRAGLFKWNGNCMKEKYMGDFRAQDKGNIFCVHRSRASLAALSFDILSFPVMAEFLLKELPTATDKALSKAEMQLHDFFFGNQSIPKGMNADVELPRQGLNAGLLTPLYVNIHEFCKPWPQCVKP